MERKRISHRPHLSTQILLLGLGIVVLSLATGVTVSILEARRQLDHQSGRQSLAIARTIAEVPEIVQAFRSEDPPKVIQPIAERMRKATGASFIVVGNRQGIRYSHPQPWKIGRHVSTDPSEALAGHEFVGVETGSMGTSVRAKVPIRNDSGSVIGFVSVGLLETKVTSQLISDLPVILIPAGIGLLLGTIGAALLARRLKRQTFGLEPDEIASLLEQREAMLHGIREGTITTDRKGAVTLVNDEARRLLGLETDVVGSHVGEIVPPGHVREVLTGNVAEPDQIVLVNDRVLVVNRMPVDVRGKAIGAVITLRDRTELERLMRELNDVRSLAHALRAQEHEFSHRLHVVAGLLDVGRYDDAVAFIKNESLVHQALVAAIVDRVADPALVGLLLGKAAVASERGVDLRITADSKLPDELPNSRDLVTVLGNLIDNALDSLAANGRGTIQVRVREEPEGMLVQVHDSGPGVDSAVVDEIFRDGFTTKVATGVGRRGLGLALISQIAQRHGGAIEVENADGAIFTVFLPRARAREVAPA
jgi:two-component system CitB family sensor kinase